MSAVSETIPAPRASSPPQPAPRGVRAPSPNAVTCSRPLRHARVHDRESPALPVSMDIHMGCRAHGYTDISNISHLLLQPCPQHPTQLPVLRLFPRRSQSRPGDQILYIMPERQRQPSRYQELGRLTSPPNASPSGVVPAQSCVSAPIDAGWSNGAWGQSLISWRRKNVCGTFALTDSTFSIGDTCR